MVQCDCGYRRKGAPKRQTMLTIAPYPEPVPVSEYGDENEWCIMRTDEPDWSVCGLHIPDGASMPDREVPDEITCAECLRLAKLFPEMIS